MVTEPRLATSALRLPGRWQHVWPRADVLWAKNLLRQNPLRRSRAVWHQECNAYSDYPFIAYVLEHGLAVTHSDQRPAPFRVPNHGSCRKGNARRLASAILAAEYAAGVISRPSPWLLEHQCRWFHPLGCVPKGADAVRIIHDFSSPAGGSVNDCIDYMRLSFDKLAAAFRVLRRGRIMAKIEITAFFRHIPIDPADWGQLAFCWSAGGGTSQVYVNTRLNFGARNAPEVAGRFSYAIDELGSHCANDARETASKPATTSGAPPLPSADAHGCCRCQG